MIKRLFHDKIGQPVLNLLKQGTSPEKLSLSIAFGDQTKICSYVHDEYNPVHIGISKASKFGSGEYLYAFRDIVQQMYENGEIHLIREAFYEDYYSGSGQ